MQDTEDYASWLESRRLITSQLSAMDVSIRELSDRIDRYNEVSREKTLDLANHADANIADLKTRLAARELLTFLWSGGIGLVTGGLAAATVQFLALHFVR